MVILLVSSLQGGLAWYTSHLGKHRLALFLLITLGLTLRIFVSTDYFLHDWDERYHALVAKHLLEHPLVFTLYDTPVLPYDYQNWAGNHIWLHKPPMTLWCIALSYKLFGVNLLTLRLPSILMSTLLIPIIYGIGKQMFNQRVAFLAAFLMSIQGFVIELSGGRFATDHPDVHFLFWVCLAVWSTLRFHERGHWKWNVLAAVSLAAAILTKWLPALILLPIWVLAADHYRGHWKNYWKPFCGFVALVVLLTVPWQWYIHTYFPLEAAWEASYNRLHLFQAVEGQEGDIFFHLNKMRMQFGELIYLPLLWIVWRFRRLITRYQWRILLLWLLLPYGFFSLVATKMPAYPLFAAPALLLITAYAWYLLRLSWRKARYPNALRLVMVLLLLLPVRFCLERIKPLKTPLLATPVYQEARDRFEQYEAGVVVFNEPFPIEAMFFSDCLAAYSWIPAREVLDSLKAEGLKLVIVAIK